MIKNLLFQFIHNTKQALKSEQLSSPCSHLYQWNQHWCFYCAITFTRRFYMFWFYTCNSLCLSSQGSNRAQTKFNNDWCLSHLWLALDHCSLRTLVNHIVHYHKSMHITHTQLCILHCNIEIFDTCILWYFRQYKNYLVYSICHYN